MKCRVVIDPQCEEEVVVHAHKRSPLVLSIEQLVGGQTVSFVGYRRQEAVPLKLSEVICFTVENGHVYAACATESLQMKCRLYQLEESLPMEFVKINQSCIANLQQVEKFSVSFGGSLMVCFKNGQREYVSRRQVKAVKKRVGMVL